MNNKIKELTCFKAYDIRGELGEELNTDIAYRIGRAYAEFLQAKTVVVGGDVRLTSEELKQALSEGLTDGGSNVLDIGLTGTEEVYFAVQHLPVDGGIEVTASHNPMNYNGMKLVREGSKPISGDTGLRAIQKLAEQNEFSVVTNKGAIKKISILDEYVSHLLSYIDTTKIKPLKLVVNSGNGAAGHIIDAIEKQFAINNVPIEFIKVHHNADGNFPNGIPNPLLPENRQDTINAILKYKADIGIAWDGDFDRCFLFDSEGTFIEGYYIVGLLAEAFLQKEKGAKIIHDPRLTYNTVDMVSKGNGIPIQCKTGHAFIKERMRQEDAVYGGEMSAHHYFRDFAYCDSGMIPWLLVIELLSVTGTSLKDMVKERMALYPTSGEINSKLNNPKKSIKKVCNKYEKLAKQVDTTDGFSFEFGNWRFNLRNSNTEPVVRLNVESKGNVALMEEKMVEILELLRS